MINSIYLFKGDSIWENFYILNINSKLYICNLPISSHNYIQYIDIFLNELEDNNRLEFLTSKKINIVNFIDCINLTYANINAKNYLETLVFKDMQTNKIIFIYPHIQEFYNKEVRKLKLKNIVC
jgi:hypothetical protein